MVDWTGTDPNKAQSALDRAVARLQGLKIHGDKPAILGCHVLGSRVGSPYRGRGPTPNSDADIFLEGSRELCSSPSQHRFIDRRLKAIADDFRAETGLDLHLLGDWKAGIWYGTDPKDVLSSGPSIRLF